MIKESLVVMALVGCDCDAKICEYIETTGGGWASNVECEAAAKTRVLAQHENYPLVVAVCRPGSEAKPMAAPVIAASAAAPEQQMVDGDTGRITSLFRTVNGYVSVRDAAGTFVSTTRRARDVLERLTTSVAGDWL